MGQSRVFVWVAMQYVCVAATTAVRLKAAAAAAAAAVLEHPSFPSLLTVELEAEGKHLETNHKLPKPAAQRKKSVVPPVWGREGGREGGVGGKGKACATGLWVGEHSKTAAGWVGN